MTILSQRPEALFDSVYRIRAILYGTKGQNFPFENLFSNFLQYYYLFYNQIIMGITLFVNDNYF